VCFVARERQQGSGIPASDSAFARLFELIGTLDELDQRHADTRGTTAAYAPARRRERAGFSTAPKELSVMTKTIVSLSSLAALLALSARASANESCPARPTSRERRQATKIEAKAPPGPSVTIDEAAGKPVKGELPAPRTVAESLFYMRLGESAMMGSDVRGGPGMGLGYRIELDRVGIDASANLSVTDVARKTGQGIEGSWLKLTAQYYFAPTADRSFYVGGGLSWGARSAMVCGERYAGSGLQAELTAGYELLRSSTMRIFVQADATVPLYMAAHQGGAPAPTHDVTGKPLPSADPPGQHLLPTMGISFGIAWGKPSCAQR
jgi:hypothetical protein